MIRPSRFGFNAETATTNAFQTDSVHGDVAGQALNEFDDAVRRMRDEGIHIIMLDEDPRAQTPDAVFPNNWISFHHPDLLILYPMQHPSRRRERRPKEVMELLNANGFTVNETFDLTGYEKTGQFLEGTGSLVFDGQAMTSYASKSTRTHAQPLQELCR